MHLALIYPGMGYVHHHAVLNAVHVALKQAGAVSVRIEYDDPRDDERLFTGIRRDTVAAIDDHHPDRLTLVGKSLGTLAMGDVLRSVRLPDHTDLVWLTPIWKDDRLYETALTSPNRALHVVGTGDDTHVSERHAEMPGETLTIEGMDHGFGIDGDVLATIDAWRRITAAVLDFAS